MILLALALLMPQQPLPQTVPASCAPPDIAFGSSVAVSSCLVTCPTSYTLKPGTMTCELDTPTVALEATTTPEVFTVAAPSYYQSFMTCDHTLSDGTVSGCHLHDDATLDQVVSVMLVEMRRGNEQLQQQASEYRSIAVQCAGGLQDAANGFRDIARKLSPVRSKIYSCRRHRKMCRRGR